MSDFLLEIGLEEVPARMIAEAEAELGRRVRDLLTRERLLTAEGKVRTYSTARRLAVLAEGVSTCQVDTEEQLTGPSWKVAFKDGVATPAAHAFAKKAGFDSTELDHVRFTRDPASLPDREAIQINGFTALRYLIEDRDPVSGAFQFTSGKAALDTQIEASPINIFSCSGNIVTSKGEYYAANIKRSGRTATEILVDELPKEVLAIYWAKNMYWRAGKPERFVRPVRWVVALLDSAVLPLEIAGITAGNKSRGHRVLHGEVPVAIDAAEDYPESLRAAHVIADVEERRQTIRKALDKATRSVEGARRREDAGLVETVVHLTEWPSVILGNFEAEYLELPEEVLVTVMRDHQKYFAVEDANGKLAAHFLAVLNTEADPEGAAIIRHGNARVLRARFKDARFFWDFDQKAPLKDRMASLKHVTFHKDLGSYYWKTEQNLAVARELAEEVSEARIAFDESALFKAVEMAKTDLTTELVKEFTELQGVIGGLYARAQGLSERVALAIYQQYQPASTEDEIPLSVEGQLLGLADRIQTITSMFGIGATPTGSKDPFALRRAANAVVKILAEGGLPLTLRDVVDAAGPSTEINDQVSAFLRERLHFYLKDVREFAYDVVNAVLAAGAADVRDAIARAEALKAVRGSEDFAAVSAAFKRIKNILRQAEEKGYALGSAKDVMLAGEAQRLADESAALAPRVADLREQRNYAEALALIATLRPVVDVFFDKVMVLDPDAKIRGAHLGLIDEVLRNFSGIADFSEIVTS